MKNRYAVLTESATGHCCFEASVVDTERDGLPVAECFDEEDAQLVCDALNRAGADTPAESNNNNGIGSERRKGD